MAEYIEREAAKLCVKEHYDDAIIIALSGRWNHDYDRRKGSKMTPKQWLKRGVKIDQEIAVLVHTRDGLKRRLTSAVGVHVEGHNESPDPHKFDRLVELNDEIDRKIAEMAGVKTEITGAIYKLEDRRYRELLMLRYINGEDWDLIADELHYSKRHVTKLHGWALDAIAKIIPPD